MSTIPPPYRDNNLGVLRPSCAAQSLRDYAAPAAQDDSETWATMMAAKIIAIDGPSGVGKTTTSRLVARALGLPHIDTGAMYRALALAATREGIDTHDE